MRTILAIAKNTFRQVVRDRILYGIIIFSLLFIGSSVLISSLGLEDNIFVMRNIGLAGIYIFGLIVTIFTGSSIVHKEVERKTTYILLSKPARKIDVLIGKFFGLFMAITATTLLMALAYLLIIFINDGNFDYKGLLAISLQIFEMAIIISILILFSVFMTPLASTIYTVLILYIGHFSGLLHTYANTANNAGKLLLNFFYYILPNFEKFNIRNIVVHDGSISIKYVTISIIYTAIYTTLVIYLTKLVFDKKDL